jgi:hypothetical protein
MDQARIPVRPLTPASTSGIAPVSQLVAGGEGGDGSGQAAGGTGPAERVEAAEARRVASSLSPGDELLADRGGDDNPGRPCLPGSGRGELEGQVAGDRVQPGLGRRVGRRLVTSVAWWVDMLPMLATDPPGRAWIVPRTMSGVRKKVITCPRTDGFADDQALRRAQDRRARAAHIVMSLSLRPRAAIPAGCGPPCR